MKPVRSVLSCLLPSAGARAALLFVSTIVAGSAIAHAQIFVTNRNANTISRFNLDGTGATTLISGLSNPYGIAASGSFLYVTNQGTTGTDGTVGRYNLDGSGFTSLVSSGLYNPSGVAVSGSSLYITNSADGSSNGTVARYNLDGTLDNTFTSITGLSGPVGIALSDSNIFVANSANGTVFKYNLDGTGGTSLISGLGGSIPLASPFGIAVSGSRLFVTTVAADNTSTTIREYDFSGGLTHFNFVDAGTSGISGLAVSGDRLFATLPGYNQIGNYDMNTGAASMFINGSGGTYGIAVSAIPEPSTYAAIAGAGMLGLAVWQRRRRTA